METELEQMLTGEGSIGVVQEFSRATPLSRQAIVHDQHHVAINDGVQPAYKGFETFKTYTGTKHRTIWMNALRWYKRQNCLFGGSEPPL